MVKITWTNSAIEDLCAIGESLVVLPVPKSKQIKKLKGIFRSINFGL